MRNNLSISVLQNLLFCIPKAAVLHGKSVGFALQKSHFRSAKSKLPFSIEIIFTKPRLLSASLLEFLKNSSFVRFTKKLALQHFDKQSARGKQIVIRNKSWGC
ncbi:hypothetical protein CLI71_11415 [Prevotella intermedia]|uniref:Uncharacterized protein n=1 Tax=Prevotella intermedia TaxID=28131 RepID=A0A2A6EC59_PREIN|nr:hypothetical protein CLI71_11415 [Prevotella intermedia]